jgi:hypothetical protein
VRRSIAFFPKDEIVTKDNEQLGLHLSVQRPSVDEADSVPKSRDDQGNVIYPELDADRDHVHFEMVPMGGESLLWLTLRKGTDPQLAAYSLRKLAGLLERHGSLLNMAEGAEGSFSSEGAVVNGPLRLSYDQNGDLILP